MTANRRIQIGAAAVVLAATGMVADASAEQVTKAEMIRAIVESIHVEPLDRVPPTPEALARLRADVRTYAEGCSGVPEAVDGLTTEAKDEVLRMKLDLCGTDPEYVRAEVECFLLGMVGAARISKLVPQLTAEEERQLGNRLDTLLSKVTASAEKHLEFDSVVTREEVVRTLGQLRVRFLREARSPTQALLKRVPSAEEVETLARKLDSRIARVGAEQRRRRSAMPLPPEDSEGYGRARAAIHDEVIAGLIGPVVDGVSQSTISEKIAATCLDTLVPGLEEANRKAAGLQRKVVEAAYATKRPALGTPAPSSQNATGPSSSDDTSLTERRRRGWELRIELPASRPAPRPTGRSAEK